MMAIRPYQKPLLAFLLGFGFSSLFMSVNFSTPPLIHTRSFRSDNAGPVSATATSTSSGNASIVIPAATSMTLTTANINAAKTRDVKIACLIEPAESPAWSFSNVRRTWGRRCNQIMSIPPRSSSTLPSLQERMLRILRQSPRPDYVFITSSDSYVIMENLKQSLLMHDFNNAFFMECSGRSNNPNRTAFFTGDCLILSRRALEVVVKSNLLITCNPSFLNFTNCLQMNNLMRTVAIGERGLSVLDTASLQACFNNFLPGSDLSAASSCLSENSPLSQSQAIIRSVSPPRMLFLEFLIYDFQLAPGFTNSSV